MSIVGCYSLDLYCDGEPDCQNGSCLHTGGSPGQYSAETGSECRRQAREDGWILNLQEQTAVCPKCAKKGLRPGPAPDPMDHENDEETTEALQPLVSSLAAGYDKG